MKRKKTISKPRERKKKLNETEQLFIIWYLKSNSYEVLTYQEGHIKCICFLHNSPQILISL